MATIWRPASPTDLSAISAVAAEVHPDFPESDAVFANRIALFPQGCFVAEQNNKVFGYAISHPASQSDLPKLNTLLFALPDHPDCLYWHDLALLSQVRGQQLGKALLPKLLNVMAASHLHTITLIAVNQSTPFWQKLGFVACHSAPPSSYGVEAQLMHMQINQ